MVEDDIRHGKEDSKVNGREYSGNGREIEGKMVWKIARNMA